MPQKSAPKPAAGRLEKKTVEALKKRASALAIPGRSEMKKSQLVKAIRAKNGKK